MSARIRIGIALSSLLAIVGILSVGCSGGTGTQATQSDQTEATPTEQSAPAPETGEALYTPQYQPTGTEKAVFKTSQGTIVVTLFGKDAPIHVGNFVELVEKGFYDNTKFHRYEPGFVIQGGDPQTKDLSAEQVVQAVQTRSVPLGTGGPGYMIKAEYDPAANPNKHTKGALGMARSQAPDSAGSQFYFAIEALPALDGSYTVFGEITEGLDVMSKLRVGDTIESVTIEKGE